MAPRSWEAFETDNPAQAIADRIGGRMPDHARIYDVGGIGDPQRFALQVAQGALLDRDVTPRRPRDIARLAQHPGPLMVVIPPRLPVAVIIASVVAVALNVAATFLLTPKLPGQNQTYESPNNSLASRSNRARPLQRICDIFGTVRSTPDLIAVPYSTFVNHQEVEIALMCIGRGSYEVSDIRDGDTMISSIAGASVAVYGPGTSPGNGDPETEIGTPIPDPVLSILKMNDVNGQVLRAPNSNAVQGNNSIRFVYPDQIESNEAGQDFTALFAPDDELTVSGANFGGGNQYRNLLKRARFYPDKRVEFDGYDPTTDFEVGQQVVLTNAVFTGTDIDGAPITVDLSGTYTIAALTATQMELS